MGAPSKHSVAFGPRIGGRGDTRICPIEWTDGEGTSEILRRTFWDTAQMLRGSDRIREAVTLE